MSGSGEELPRVRLIVPGVFSFSTFILPYPADAKAYCGHEFTQLESFPLHALPEPLHHGMMRAVRRLPHIMEFSKKLTPWDSQCPLLGGIRSNELNRLADIPSRRSDSAQ